MNFSLSSFICVGGGAALGAWLRWGLGLLLNPWFPSVPLGTLVSNLLGGYLVGVAVMLFHGNASLPPELKLLVITGFLGGLTTFSSFSAEVVTLLQRTQYALALSAVMAHVLGSLAMTGLGMLTVQQFVQQLQK